MAERLIEAAEAPAHPAWRLGNLLDVRPRSVFLAGHAVGAHNLPLASPTGPAQAGSDPELDLERRIPSVLLPPRHEPLLVFAERAELALRVRDFLRGRGRPLADACVLEEQARGDPPAQWAVGGPGANSLWRAPEFLVAHAGLLPAPALGPVLDLGAGAGRAAVWLAARGWRVTAIDRLPEALALAARLAVGHDLGVGRLTLLRRDLRAPGAVPRGPWAAILAFRYLDRELCARAPGLLMPGGIVIMRTFGPGDGHRRPCSPRHRLAGGEWLRLFPDPPFEILVHVEDHDPDGRPAAGVVARLRP